MDENTTIVGLRTYNNNPYDKQLDVMKELSNGFRKTIHTAMRTGFEYDIAEALRQELAKMEESDRFKIVGMFSNEKRRDIVKLIKALADYKKHV